MFKVIVRYVTEVFILTIMWSISLIIYPAIIWLSIFATLMTTVGLVIEIMEYLEEKK